MKNFNNLWTSLFFLFAFSVAPLNAQVVFDIKFTSNFGGNTEITVLSNGEVLVADYNNHLIKRFNNDGNFINSFGGSGSGDGQFNRPNF